MRLLDRRFKPKKTYVWKSGSIITTASANRGKEEFMALLSHELRNPLSPILNALTILRQIKTNDPIIEQAGDIINRQVMQMVRLVDDLLDISRITKGKLRLIKVKVEMRVVANRAAETARPLMDARKHQGRRIKLVYILSLCPLARASWTAKD